MLRLIGHFTGVAQDLLNVSLQATGLYPDHTALSIAALLSRLDRERAVAGGRVCFVQRPQTGQIAQPRNALVSYFKKKYQL